MNRLEHLLTIVAEECTEVGQRASKALRFGLHEIQEGQDLTNAQRLIYEFNDLVAAMKMLYGEGHLPPVMVPAMQMEKMTKVEKYLKYSEQQGTLQRPEEEADEFIKWWAKQQAGGSLSDKLEQFRAERKKRIVNLGDGRVKIGNETVRIYDNKSGPEVETVNPAY